MKNNSIILPLEQWIALKNAYFARIWHNLKQNWNLYCCRIFLSKKDNLFKRNVFLLSICLLGWANALYAQNPEVERLFRQSVIEKDVSIKRELRKKIVELDPYGAYGYFCKAWLSEDNKETLDLLNNAILLKNDEWVFYNNRAGTKSNLKDYKGAMEDYNTSIKLNVNEATPYRGRGLLKYDVNDFSGALIDLNKALSLDPTDAAAYRYRGRIKNSMYDYKGAEEDYQKATKFDPEIRWNVINQVKGMPLKLIRTNLGMNVNTKYVEVAPVISPDGKTLYFTVDGHPQNIGFTSRKEDQDIWYCSLQPDGNWSKAKNIGKPLNNIVPNNILAVLPDNNTLLVSQTYDYRGDYAGQQGLSLTYRTEDGWSIPQTLKIRNYYSRSKYYSYCMSSNQKVILMGIQRDDSKGENDIYASFLQTDNTWSEPLNLGETINTIKDDGTPFLASDGVTLFFSSYGYEGYGSGDIFMSRRLDESWTNWSKPENLGPAINTSGWDAYFTIPASGKYAYLVSEGIEGSNDIFKVELPSPLKPQAVTLIAGKVYDAKTKQPIGTEIIFNDLKTGNNVGIARSNPLDGNYQIVLPAGKNYEFLAQKKGFYPISANLDLSQLNAYQEIKRDLALSPLEQGQSIRLNNLFFDFDKYELRSESKGELRRLWALLNENPSLSIQVEGHTDSVGDDPKNQLLSENRASAVRDYLIQNGISESRITTKGYGETNPIASNDTEQGKQLNRRVEFKVLKN
ncbi:MAG: OmpA family protein [Microscillaceae bacterium]|jgi:outer membrane protein OmpA-like peptidoglycan-associated protein|nr:OmpA family protein [Microscillaceae bacterium]